MMFRPYYAACLHRQASIGSLQAVVNINNDLLLRRVHSIQAGPMWIIAMFVFSDNAAICLTLVVWSTVIAVANSRTLNRCYSLQGLA